MQVIYRITSPSGSVYIGQTKNLRDRLWHYRNYKCEKQKRLYASLKKYSFDSHIVEVVHRFPFIVAQPVIDNYEKYAIQMHKNMGLDLMNLTDGGQGVSGNTYGRKPTKKNRDAIRLSTQGEAHFNSKLTEQQVLYIRATYLPGVRGLGLRQLARNFNVDRALISRIVKRENWKHI